MYMGASITIVYGVVLCERCMENNASIWKPINNVVTMDIVKYLLFDVRTP